MTESTAPVLASPARLQPLLAPADFAELHAAVLMLEAPSLAARVAAMVGSPLDGLLAQLPNQTRRRIEASVEKTLRSSLLTACATMDPDRRPARPWRTNLLAVGAGAIGGAAGLPGFLLELPVSTTVIFRAIAEQARAAGENVRAPETTVACLQVFAFGGPSPDDDTADSGYLATRLAMAQLARQAVHALDRAAAGSVPPMALQFVARVAARFGIVVSWKAAAQLAPLVGAAGGATVNHLFLCHYQSVAAGHFTVRRLERDYGVVPVRQAYRRIRDRLYAANA